MVNKDLQNLCNNAKPFLHNARYNVVISPIMPEHEKRNKPIDVFCDLKNLYSARLSCLKKTMGAEVAIT